MHSISNQVHKVASLYLYPEESIVNLSNGLSFHLSNGFEKIFSIFTASSKISQFIFYRKLRHKIRLF